MESCWTWGRESEAPIMDVSSNSFLSLSLYSSEIASRIAAGGEGVVIVEEDCVPRRVITTGGARLAMMRGSERRPVVRHVFMCKYAADTVEEHQVVQYSTMAGRSKLSTRCSQVQEPRRRLGRDG